MKRPAIVQSNNSFMEGLSIRSASFYEFDPLHENATKMRRLVAEQFALAVQDQTRWRLFDIPTPLFAGVSGYLNLSRRRDAPVSRSENQ